MVSEFFRALGDVLPALWSFIDGFRGLAVLIVSGGLVAVFLGLAHVLRPQHGWMSAIFGGLGVTVLFWWIFGILPSAWIYFLDSNKAIIGGRLIPNALPGFSNFYNVFKDTVVLVETGVAVGAVALVAARVQKRYPRALAEGEEQRSQSGGYK